MLLLLAVGMYDTQIEASGYSVYFKVMNTSSYDLRVLFLDCYENLYFSIRMVAKVHIVLPIIYCT